MVTIELDLKASLTVPYFSKACIVAVLLDVMNPDVSQSEE